MSPAFPARRRAEQFDAMVEGTSTTSLDAAPGDLLELVVTLRGVPQVQARPEFVAALRERLLLAAETELAPGSGAARPAIRPKRSSRDRRLATALGGFALVGATASMAVAAQNALPGDELYPMKRAMENAHAGLSVGNDVKGATLLANASGRLAEIDELTHRDNADDTDADVIADTLAAFSDQATEASDLLLDAYAEDGDEESITELAEFTATSLNTLEDLAPDVPLDARGALAEATSTIEAIKGAAIEACPTCAAPVLAQNVSALPDPIGQIVRHPGVVLPSPVAPVKVPPTAPAPTVQPDPGPSGQPAADPTDAPVPDDQPTTAAPDPSVLPTASPEGGDDKGGKGRDKGDKDPLEQLTDPVQVNVNNPVNPAAVVSEVADAAEDVVDSVTGVLGGGGRKVTGDAPGHGLLGG